MKDLRKKILMGVGGLLIIALALIFPKLGTDVPSDKYVINQYPFSGNMKYQTSEGFYWQLFGDERMWSKAIYVDFKGLNRHDDGRLDVIGLKNPAFSITYSDKGTGYVIGSILFEVPSSPEHLYAIQSRFSTEERLINELLKPTIDKVFTATGTLMSSLESVSEKRTDITTYVIDQLNNGMYATGAQQVERINTITQEVETVTQKYILTDSLGNYKRSEEAPFIKFGLRATALNIVDYAYEKATMDQISTQRNLDMSIVTAKASAALAIQSTIQATEEGKKRAEVAKWQQEEIKAVAVTKAQQEFEVAQLEAAKAKEIAKKILEEGRAAAEANRLKVNAGLTPQEKAEWEYKTKVGIASAIADSKQKITPEILIIGDNKNGNANPMDAVGLNMMLDVVEKAAKK